MSDTPIVDEAAERGQHLGPAGNRMMSDIWNVARRLELERAELIEALKGTIFLYERLATTRADIDQINYVYRLLERMK